MEKRLFIVNKKVYEQKFDERSWEALLNASRLMAQERKENTKKTFDGEFHIIYGYVCPNIGHYVSAMHFMDNRLYVKFIRDMLNKDKDVKIYAVHSFR